MLKDASKKEMKYAGPSMMGPGMKEEQTYQELCFSADQLPQISSWKVGEKYQLLVEVQMMEHSLEKEGGKTVEEAEFDVLRVGLPGDAAPSAENMAKQKLGIK